MIVLTFAVWIVLFIVGFALVVWPNLALYRSEPGFGALSFLDAPYFAGVTVSVLGYGDITPMDGRLQTLSWMASAAAQPERPERRWQTPQWPV